MLHGIDVGGDAVGRDEDVIGGDGGDDDVGGGGRDDAVIGGDVGGDDDVDGGDGGGDVDDGDGDGDDDVGGDGDGEGSLSVWRSCPCFPRQRQHSIWIVGMMTTKKSKTVMT